MIDHPVCERSATTLAELPNNPKQRIRAQSVHESMNKCLIENYLDDGATDPALAPFAFKPRLPLNCRFSAVEPLAMQPLYLIVAVLFARIAHTPNSLIPIVSTTLRDVASAR